MNLLYMGEVFRGDRVWLWLSQTLFISRCWLFELLQNGNNWWRAQYPRVVHWTSNLLRQVQKTLEDLCVFTKHKETLEIENQNVQISKTTYKKKRIFIACAIVIHTLGSLPGVCALCWDSTCLICGRDCGTHENIPEQRKRSRPNEAKLRYVLSAFWDGRPVILMWPLLVGEGG